MVARVVKLDQAVKVRNAETSGSVQNARLIATREADYALIQSNLAAMAVAGEGPFARPGAVTSLRARELQRLATRHPIRLVSLEPAAIERLVGPNPGLIRLLLPANTYPGQKQDVVTVAATALLVTHSDVPEAEAALMLRLVFENPDYLSAGSAQGAKISKRSGLRGITIPVHRAASRYFGAPAPPGPGSPGAKPKG